MKIKKTIIFLILFLFCATSFFAQTIAPAENQKLYTKQDIKFELLIPNAHSGNVQILTPNLPYGVTLKTLRKSEQYGDVNGTLVELWFNFDKTGTYDLPRLSVLVQNRRKYFYFEEFTISENPANMLPKIVIQFDNGTTITSDDKSSKKALFSTPSGQKISFKVNLQYATQLVQFNWDIPKDSIFSQVKTYDITEIKYREKNYSSELIPVADFEWTPLSKGQNAMPKIKLTATGYSGYRNELSLPEFFINVTKSEEKAQSDESDMFEQAFTEDSDLTDNEDFREITIDDCNEILELRHKEHSNFFYSSKYKKLRQTKEDVLGLSSNSDEFYLGFLYMSIGFLVIFIFLTVLAILKRKNVLILIFTVFIVISSIGTIYSLSQNSKKYGISAGCTLKSIPEDSATEIGSISIGNRVKILEKAGNWCFVELGTINGWAKSEEVLE